MFLYIARHAWAGHFGDAGWGDDSLRELTPEGAERYARLIEALADREFAPQRIATSPYARCRQTAEIISRYSPLYPPIEDLHALTPGVDFEGLLEWTRAHHGEDLCWCGHNPDVEVLAAAMLGDGRANVRFAKGAISAIRIHGQVEPGCGELYWHVTAKSLGI